MFSSVQFSRSVVSDSLWPHESQHARPPCPCCIYVNIFAYVLYFNSFRLTFKSMIYKLINLRIMFSYNSRYESKFLFLASFAEKTSFPPLNCLHAYIGYYLSTCVLSISCYIWIYFCILWSVSLTYLSICTKMSQCHHYFTISLYKVFTVSLYNKVI